jgi:hypothetical protein
MSFSETQNEYVGVMSAVNATSELDINGRIRDSYRYQRGEFPYLDPESRAVKVRADNERRTAMLIGPTAVRLSRLEELGHITVPGGVLYH